MESLQWSASSYDVCFYIGLDICSGFQLHLYQAINSYFLLVKLSPNSALGIKCVFCVEAVKDHSVLRIPGVLYHHHSRS